MAVFPGVLATSMLTLGFGRVAEGFDVSYPVFQLRNVLFFGFFSTSLAYFGAAVGRLGPRRCLLAGQALFVLSTLAAWGTRSWPLFLAAQCAQAMADGLVVPCQMSLIRALVPPERLGWAFGWFEGCLALAGLVGPAAGGFMMARFGWRSMFLALAVVAMACLAVSARLHTPPPPVDDRPAPSLASAALLLAILVSLQLGINGGMGPGWPYMAWGGGMVILGAGFLAVERLAPRRGRCRLVPWEGLQVPEFGFSVLRIFLVFLVSNGIMLHNPTALQAVSKLRATSIGAVLTGVAFLEVLIQPLLGRISDRQGRGAMVAGLGLTTLATAALAWIPGSQSPLVWLVVATTGIALGSALFTPAQLRQATLAAPPSERDRFMGFYMFIQFSTGAIAGPLMASFLVESPDGPMTPQSYGTFVAVCAGILSLGWVTTLIVRRGSSKRARLPV